MDACQAGSWSLKHHEVVCLKLLIAMVTDAYFTCDATELKN